MNGTQKVNFLIKYVHLYKYHLQRMFSKIINKGYSADQCQLCRSQFSLIKFQRIHKCKRCGKFVCWRCGDQKHKVMDQDGKWTPEPHRVCNTCNDELNRIHKLIKDKKLNWAHDSLVSQQWINRIHNENPNKKTNKPKDYEYQHFLKLFNTNYKNFQEQLQIIDKDVIKGRTDYLVFNFSLREFFYIVQNSGVNRETSRANIANVLYAVAARFDQIGYVQGMSSIAAFLLCFCSEQSAYTIFCDLIQNIFPDKFLVRGNYGVNLIGLLAQTHFLKQYFVHILTKVKFPLISHYRDPFTQQQIQHVRLMVELNTSKALLSLFVNFLAFSHLEFIWKQMSLHRSFEVPERALLAALYLRRQEIIERRSGKQLESLFENIDLEQFIEAYYDLDIDPTIKSKLIEEYYQSLNKKWSNNSEHNIKQLHRCTNFTVEQIKLLQVQFSNRFKDSEDCRVINKEEFVQLIKCYYDILKQNGENEAPILEITSFFVSKIFDSFVTSKSVNATSSIIQEKQRLSQQITNENLDRVSISSSAQGSFKVSPTESYLDFREFVCCFSLCTKSLLKDRMCAILNTFQDRNKKISFNSFSKLIKNLCEISPSEIDDKKEAFLERMNRYFSTQEQGISINQLYILLNDNFITDLTVYIRSDAPEIIKNTVQKFNQLTGRQGKLQEKSIQTKAK